MAEYKSSGPGFDLASRLAGNITQELTASQARAYRTPKDVFSKLPLSILSSCYSKNFSIGDRDVVQTQKVAPRKYIFGFSCSCTDPVRQLLTLIDEVTPTGGQPNIAWIDPGTYTW